MKKLLLIFLMYSFSVMAAYAPARKVLYIEYSIPVQPYEKLWKVVCMAESSNRPIAYNKDENAIGIVQIRPVRLRDFNDRTGKNYTMDDMYDVTISKEVFMYYAVQMHYSDTEKIAKRWNGSGRKTIAYWKRVKVLL